MVRGGRASVAGVLQLGASAGRRRVHAQRRCNRIGTGTGGPPRSTFRRTLLCPTSLGPLGGRRAVRGDHPPDARRVHPEPHYLCREWCALRHQSYDRLGPRECRPRRRPHTPAGGCRGSGRYGRSSPLDHGVKQLAKQRAGPVVRNIRRQWFCGASAGVALNIHVRIASAAYAVPPDDEAVEAVLERERDRVETTLAPLSAQSRRKAVEGLGLSRVRVCGGKQPYDLVLEAASTAIAEAGITARDVNLIVDYSTFPGENSQD